MIKPKPPTPGRKLEVKEILKKGIAPAPTSSVALFDLLLASKKKQQKTSSTTLSSSALPPHPTEDNGNLLRKKRFIVKKTKKKKKLSILKKRLLQVKESILHPKQQPLVCDVACFKI